MKPFEKLLERHFHPDHRRLETRLVLEPHQLLLVEVLEDVEGLRVEDL